MMIPICLFAKERVIEKERVLDEGAEESYTLRDMAECLRKNKYLLIFLYVIMTVTLFGCCFLLIKKKRMESIFCCMLIAIGMLYMFILPPFVVPDEPSHFVTAYSQSSKLLGEQVYDENGKILVSSDKLWGDSLRQRKVSKEAYYQFFEGVLGKLENKMEMVSTRPPLTTKHPGYIPQILGISMARAINMNSEQIDIIIVAIIGFIKKLLTFKFNFTFLLNVVKAIEKATM